MSTVSLVRCERYDRAAVEQSVKMAVDLLGGISRFVKPGDRVLLKPNLLSAHAPERCVTTDPEVVRAVALLVMEAKGAPFIGDSPGMGSFRRIAAKTGMSLIAKELGIDVAELSNPRTVSLPTGTKYRKLEIASQALDADVVINLPKLKAHCQMLLTLAVKNLFGTVVGHRKMEWHHMAGVDRDSFASLLKDIYHAVSPALNIMDGVWGMEGHGPSNGVPRHLGMIAASNDGVAMDMAICHLLNVPLRSFPLYRVARSGSTGETDLGKIVFKGDPRKDFEVTDFCLPSLDSLHILPGMLDGFTKRFLVSKPVQNDKACLRCGQCVKICPEDAIEMGDSKIRFDYDRCIRCYCCQEICPQDSIHFHRGFLVRILNRFGR